MGRNFASLPRESLSILRKEASAAPNSFVGVPLSSRAKPPERRYSPKLRDSISVSSQSLSTQIKTKGVSNNFRESIKRCLSTFDLILV